MNQSDQRVQITAGPWVVSEHLCGSENHRGYSIRADGWALAEVRPGDEDGLIGRANTRAIAKVPEMIAEHELDISVMESAVMQLRAASFENKAAHFMADRLQNRIAAKRALLAQVKA